eukprot:TRINITY_DN43178_c0_g1_i1.p1 TRINITY_DN43178_c0_g1~~TRINITY_DN43178_c0_g1_i1.p1  ORF type:complete len:334 (-),score=45.02 TRINITY_DN43178_c0_g1_i1:46-1047(-)
MVSTSTSAAGSAVLATSFCADGGECRDEMIAGGLSTDIAFQSKKCCVSRETNRFVVLPLGEIVSHGFSNRDGRGARGRLACWSAFFSDFRSIDVKTRGSFSVVPRRTNVNPLESALEEFRNDPEVKALSNQLKKPTNNPFGQGSPKPFSQPWFNPPYPTPPNSVFKRRLTFWNNETCPDWIPREFCGDGPAPSPVEGQGPLRATWPEKEPRVRSPPEWLYEDRPLPQPERPIISRSEAESRAEAKALAEADAEDAAANGHPAALRKLRGHPSQHEQFPLQQRLAQPSPRPPPIAEVNPPPPPTQVAAFGFRRPPDVGSPEGIEQLLPATPSFI